MEQQKLTKEALSPVQRLFKKAQKEGGFDYLYILVRVDGIQCYDGYQDTLIALRDWLAKPDHTDISSEYRFLIAQTDVLELLQNLLNAANRKHYQIRAFIDLKKGTFPNAVWPSTREKVEYLIRNARASEFSDLAKQLKTAYKFVEIDNGAPVGALDTAFGTMMKLLRDVINCYFSERIKFKTGPQYMKVPASLDVLEFIKDDEFGLSGLRVHFPQGCQRLFIARSSMNFATGMPSEKKEIRSYRASTFST